MPKNEKANICRVFNALNLKCDGILSAEGILESWKTNFSTDERTLSG